MHFLPDSDDAGARLNAVLKKGGWLVVPLGGLLLYFLQDKLVFNPDRTPAVTRCVGADHRRRAVTLHMKDGTKLRGWWMRPDKDAAAAAPAVLYFGGRSEEVSWVTDLASTLLGMHVLFVNYRGYGESGGHPSEHALFSDALELYDWLGSRPGWTSHAWQSSAEAWAVELRRTWRHAGVWPPQRLLRPTTAFWRLPVAAIDGRLCACCSSTGSNRCASRVWRSRRRWFCWPSKTRSCRMSTPSA